MICQFCRQDVQDPCQTAQDMRQRAMNRVDRCENALKEEMKSAVNPSDGQSAGSI